MTETTGHPDVKGLCRPELGVFRKLDLSRHVRL